MKKGTLEHALQLAAEWHDGQLDKSGKPVILHVLRVVIGCSTYGTQVVAALHDTLEDAETDMVRRVREANIQTFFSKHVYDAVRAVTRENHEDYLKSYIPRIIAGGVMSMTVKLADLQDNMDLSRFSGKELTAEDMARYNKYAKAKSMILQALIKTS